MRVLLLSQWYTPEPTPKIHSLGHGLVMQGHSVSAITGFPNYPQGKIYPGYRQQLWQREERDGVRVLRLPLYPSHDRAAPRRALNYLSFAASAACLAPFLSEGADIMWVYHPPLTVGLPALSLSLVKRIPFVYEIQDMWPETIASTGMVSNGLATRALGALAKRIYQRASALIVVSPGFKRNLINKGVPADKIHVIPNWADEDIYRPVPYDRALAAEHGLLDRFNVIFAGNLGAAQALRTVLDAAAQLRDLADVQFVLIGDGLDQAALRQRAAEQGLANVRFIGRQPERQIPSFLAIADVLLIHLKRDPLFEITIPSKTTAYLACGRPILAAVAGDAAEVVREANAGVVCPPQDPEALAASVRVLHKMSRAEREAFGQAGRAAFLQNFTRSRLLERYQELFHQVVERHQARQGFTAARTPTSSTPTRG